MGTGSSRQAREAITQQRIISAFSPEEENESAFTGRVPTSPKVRSRPFPEGVAAGIADKGALPVKQAPSNYVSF